jgi:hypothetical protein
MTVYRRRVHEIATGQIAANKVPTSAVLVLQSVKSVDECDPPTARFTDLSCVGYWAVRIAASVLQFRR